MINWLIQPETVRGYAKDKPKEEDGRIIVDLVKPHILEDMDFFRERALFFEKNGKYTNLPVNSNPKSEYAAFWKEELRRWKYGLVRESDGEWIPGAFYFYLNYAPIWKVIERKTSSGKVRGDRVFEIQNGPGTNFTFEGGMPILEGTDYKFTVDSVSDNSSILEVAAEYYEINQTN